MFFCVLFFLFRRPFRSCNWPVPFSEEDCRAEPGIIPSSQNLVPPTMWVPPLFDWTAPEPPLLETGKRALSPYLWRFSMFSCSFCTTTFECLDPEEFSDLHHTELCPSCLSRLRATDQVMDLIQDLLSMPPRGGIGTRQSQF